MGTTFNLKTLLMSAVTSWDYKIRNAARGTRTPNLSITNRLHYQLCYSGNYAYFADISMYSQVNFTDLA